MLYMNIHSLKQYHEDEVHCLIQIICQKSSAPCFHETWLRPDDDISAYNLEGYLTMISKTRVPGFTTIQKTGKS